LPNSRAVCVFVLLGIPIWQLLSLQKDLEERQLREGFEESEESLLTLFPTLLEEKIYDVAH